MSAINGDRVAEITSACGKKLKVQEVAGLLVATIEEISARNPIVKEIIDKCGIELCSALFGTIQTMFALHLLARTHNSKEFEEILKQVNESTNESEA